MPSRKNSAWSGLLRKAVILAFAVLAWFFIKNAIIKSIVEGPVVSADRLILAFEGAVVALIIVAITLNEIVKISVILRPGRRRHSTTDESRYDFVLWLLAGFGGSVLILLCFMHFQVPPLAPQTLKKIASASSPFSSSLLRPSFAARTRTSFLSQQIP